MNLEKEGDRKWTFVSFVAKGFGLGKGDMESFI